jgi:hypothetical protein
MLTNLQPGCASGGNPYSCRLGAEDFFLGAEASSDPDPVQTRLNRDAFRAPVLSVRVPIWALRTWSFSVDADLGVSSQLG